ncbi:MAG: hypothetical protein AAF743_02030 [Planctomycetota bacterium]
MFRSITWAALPLLVGVTVVQAEEIYSTSFEAADGFVEGEAIHQTDGWRAQNEPGAALVAADVDGAGEVRFDANFLRGCVSTLDALGVDDFSPGDRLTITVTVRALEATSPGFDANVLRVGLSIEPGLGKMTPSVGVTLGAGANGVWDVCPALGTIDDKTDTTVTLDTTPRTLTTIITKSETVGAFEVTNVFEGESFTHTVTDADLYAASTADLRPVLQAQGQSHIGGIAVESFTVAFEADAEQ